MDYTKQVFIDLLANCICEEKKINEIDFSKLDSEELLFLSSENTVSAIVYTSLKDFENAPEELMEKLKREFSRNALKMAKFDTVQNQVVEHLKDSDIPYAIVKGKTIAKYYPSPELRNMADIDVLVWPKDYKKAKELFHSFCDEKPGQVDNEYEYSFMTNGVTIELQNNLAYEKNLAGVFDYEKYFSDLLNHTIKDGDVCELEPTYSFIFNIYHMAQHFYYAGCGVRMVMDIAVLIKHFRDTFDWEEILSTLKEIKLFEFATNIFSIIDEWFGITIPISSYEKVQVPDDCVKYIINAGIFGRASINSDVSYFRKNGGFLKWLFPSYGYMRKYYKWFENKPAILLPAAYVGRMIHGLRMRGGVVKGISVTGQTKKDYETHKEIVSKMGL